MAAPVGNGLAGGALVVQADALRLPLPDASVDLVVTSPPYWSLRDYRTGHPAELGSEATPAAFLQGLWAATAEMARVLKPAGSIWVNLGDAYADRANSGPSAARGSSDGQIGRADRPARPRRYGVARKSRYGLPWAYALGATGMLAALGGPDPGLGLTLRAEVIWHKPNGLPEPARDRVRCAHEVWFHLTKSARYYAAVDRLREPYSPAAHAAGPGGARWRDGATAPTWGKGGSQSIPTGARRTPPDPLGKLPGSVWSIPSEPLDLPDYFVWGPHGPAMADAGPLWRYCDGLRHHGHTGPVLVREIDHSAAFPSEWPRRLILGWSPERICLACGQGRVPVADRWADPSVRPNGPTRARAAMGATDDGHRPGGPAFGAGPPLRAESRAVLAGEACACTPATDHPERRGRSWDEHGHDPVAGNRTAATGRSNAANAAARAAAGPAREYHLAGWQPPPARPAVVLDPFAGTGTTVMVASALGRVGIGVDLSADYCQLARWRAGQSGHASKALARTNLERQATLAGLAAAQEAAR